MPFHTLPWPYTRTCPGTVAKTLGDPGGVPPLLARDVSMRLPPARRQEPEGRPLLPVSTRRGVPRRPVQLKTRCPVLRGAAADQRGFLLCVDLILDHLQWAARLFPTLPGQDPPWLSSPPLATERQRTSPGTQSRGAGGSRPERAARGGRRLCDAISPRAARAAATLCAAAAGAARRRSLGSGGRLKGGALPPGTLQPARGPTLGA